MRLNAQEILPNVPDDKSLRWHSGSYVVGVFVSDAII